MMIASFSQGDKSDTLSKLADDLTGFVQRSVRDGNSLDEVERGVFQRLLSMGRIAIDLCLKGQGDGDLGESVVTQEGLHLHRSDTGMTRTLRTIFGEHSFEAFVYSPGSKRKIALRPIDARLNLPAGKASYLLQEFSQLFCVEKAFGVGARQFETVFQQRLVRPWSG